MFFIIYLHTQLKSHPKLLPASLYLSPKIHQDMLKALDIIFLFISSEHAHDVTRRLFAVLALAANKKHRVLRSGKGAEATQ